MTKPQTALLVLLLIFLAGCATSPSPRLYVTSSDTGWRDMAVRDALQSDYVVRFAPVQLAAYLDRPQIVTRLTRHEIRVDHFNRWGMPLDMLATEILAGHVARELPEAYLEISPNRSLTGPGYLIQVDILRMDGRWGDSFELIAQWTIVPAEAPVRAVARRLTRHVQGPGEATYEAYVESMRLGLQQLAGDIAAAIQAARTTDGAGVRP